MPPKRQTPGVSPVAGISTGINENIEFHSAEEFTRSVKRKLSTSTRTGQACDRCKIRKIRCDGLPGGCSPCMQNRTECRTTDRISQRAMPRGYVENLESKVGNLEARVKELEAALELERSARGEHAGSPGMINSGQRHEVPSLRNGTDPYNPANGTKPTMYINGNRNIKISPQPHQNKFPVDDRIRCFGAGCYYLGLSSGAATLHTMRDSALSVLGVEIDLSDVDPTDTKNPGIEDGIGESYASCLSSMFNTNPKAPQNLELPPKEECMRCTEWFFAFSYSYLPIVHRPTFMKQLERIYDDRDYQPSAGVIVQVHMMVAICYWQTGTRGHLKDTADKLKLKKSYEHYHFALTHFYHLLHSASLEDLQALCLILQHIRSFRKPGASWFIARLAVSMAVELGLHRSTKKWQAPNRKVDYIEEEMRKRVWWCLFAIEVNLCAKLGRPAGITEGDYDIELPERIDDEYLTAEGFVARPEGVEGCKFDVGIEMFKVIPLYIEINTSLYAVARPNRDKYVELVEQLEKRLMQWRNQVPKWISHDSPRIEHRYHALSLDLWYHEARLLMRHPALSLSPSPIFNKSSVKICVESSREILHLTDKIRGENSYLDATWYTITIQLLAALTILFSMWKKGEQEVTQQEIDQVKKDMDLCQEIMSDIGALLGSPNSLSDIVRRLTQGTLEYLYQQQRNNQQIINTKTNRVLQGTGSSTLLSPPLYSLNSSMASGGYPISSPSLQPPKLSAQLLSPIESDRLNRMPSPSQQLYPPTSQALSPTSSQPQTQSQQSYVLDTLSIPTDTNTYDTTPYTSQQQQTHSNQSSYYPQHHQPRQEPPLHLSHLSHSHHTHPHSHHHSPHSHPHHPHHPPPTYPWTYPGSDWEKYAEYVSTIDINGNPHTTNLVQGLAGLMNLSAADSMINAAAVAAVASASRPEEVGGGQVQVQIGVSSAGGSGGGGGSGWGVIGVGMGGGYSIAGVDGGVVAGRSGGGGAGQIDGGN